MPMIRYYVRTNKLGSVCEDEFFMDDDDWEMMSEREKQEFMFEQICDSGMFNWDWEERDGPDRVRVQDVASSEGLSYPEGSGTCLICGREAGVRRVRQRTQYADDRLNWFTGCEACIEENSDYWDEMWMDYYSEVL